MKHRPGSSSEMCIMELGFMSGMSVQPTILLLQVLFLLSVLMESSIISYRDHFFGCRNRSLALQCFNLKVQPIILTLKTSHIVLGSLTLSHKFTLLKLQQDVTDTHPSLPWQTSSRSVLSTYGKSASESR